MSCAGISSPGRESFPYRAFGSDVTQERKNGLSWETYALSQDRRNAGKCMAPRHYFVLSPVTHGGDNFALMALKIRNTRKC